MTHSFDHSTVITHHDDRDTPLLDRVAKRNSATRFEDDTQQTE